MQDSYKGIMLIVEAPSSDWKEGSSTISRVINHAIIYFISNKISNLFVTKRKTTTIKTTKMIFLTLPILLDLANFTIKNRGEKK